MTSRVHKKTRDEVMNSSKTYQIATVVSLLEAKETSGPIFYSWIISATFSIRVRQARILSCNEVVAREVSAFSYSCSIPMASSLPALPLPSQLPTRHSSRHSPPLRTSRSVGPMMAYQCSGSSPLQSAAHERRASDQPSPSSH